MIKSKEREINTVLTIDIGGLCLKMAEFTVDSDSDSITLERYATKDMPVELAETDFAAAFAETFKEAVAENAFTSNQVRISISSLHAFQRLSKLPPLMNNRSRAAAVVEGEAKLTVPYPLDEVLWDYQLIRYEREFEVDPEPDEFGNVPEGKVIEKVEELESLFVAIKNDLATALCTTLLDMDYEVLSVEVATTAIYNAARANMFGEESCDMILDLGGRGSNLIIMDGSRVFVRSIPIGGNTITQQIAKEFNIGCEDAEEMKRKHGFVALGGAYEDSDSEVAATISKIARNVMTRLHGEINRSINTWRSMFNGNRPAALFISGGSSIMPYVPHFLNEKLHLEVSFLNTFPVVTISENIDKQALLEVAHLFPPMIGMSIRHLRTCPVEISLIPKIVSSARDLQQKKPYFYASAVCALLCLLVFYGGVSARTLYDKKLESLASTQLQRAEEIDKQIRRESRVCDDARGQYENLQRVAESRANWVALLNELQRITPPNMWFTEIEGVKDFLSGEEQSKPVANPGMMDPGMGPGMDPGMMGPGMDEPPPPPPKDVIWLRLKGHSLVMNEKDAKGVEDYFKENLAKSSFFAMDDAGNFKIPARTMNSGRNNITSFVIYVKLKNPIKQ